MSQRAVDDVELPPTAARPSTVDSVDLPPSGLRIGFVTAFPPGRNSLCEFGYHFANHLGANDGVASLVVLADETEAGPPDVSSLDGDHDVTARAVWRFNDPMSLPKLVKAIREEHLDAVIFNLQFATFGDTKVAGGLGLLTPAVVTALGVPTGVVLHNLSDQVDMQEAGFTDSKAVAWVMKTAGRALTKALLRADYVAFTIPAYVEHVRASYNADSALLAPHGAFEEMEEPPFGLPPGDKRRILAFGKFGTYKTVNVLVDAFRLLNDRSDHDLELVIAGTDSPNSPGYLDGVAESCTDLDNVVFTGYVAEEDVAGLFLDSSVVVFPYTSTTGSSGVLHQAGSYGRPAVLPTIGDFVDVIEEEGFVGEYFEPGNAAELADAIERLVDDEELNAAQGQRNYLAAAGIPMADVIDWHILHLLRVIEAKKSAGNG